jgi:hypothetical protein
MKHLFNLFRRKGCRICWAFTCLTALQSAGAQDSLPRKLSGQFEQRYRYFSEDLLSQPLNPLPQYATLEAGARFTGGSHHQAQDAAKQREYFLHTSGTRQVKRFLVSGSFRYTHTLQDSVRYTLRYGLNDPEPYYLYAAAAGNWQATRYALTGYVSRPFAGDRLVAGAGADYEVSNAWRSNDPRPEYFRFRILPSATVQYRFAPQWTAGVAAGYLKQATENYLEYRNQDYEQGGLYPQYINRIQYGYGFTQARPTSFIKNNTSGYRTQLLVQGKTGAGSFTAKGGYTHTTAYFTGAANAFDNTAYGSFTERIWTGAVYWEYSSGRNTWSATARVQQHAGKDFNNALNGNNYLYRQEAATIHPLFTRYGQAGKPLYELGLRGNYNLLSRTDGNKGQCAVYRNADVAVQGAYYLYPGAGQLLKAGLTAGITLPAGDSLNIVQPVYEFAAAVVYPDYYFYTATKYTGTLELLYNFSIRRTAVFLKAAGQYQAAILKNTPLPALYRPGTNRWWAQLSAGITL